MSKHLSAARKSKGKMLDLMDLERANRGDIKPNKVGTTSKAKAATTKVSAFQSSDSESNDIGSDCEEIKAPDRKKRVTYTIKP